MLKIFSGKDEWEYEFVEEDFSSYNTESTNKINLNLSEQDRNCSYENRPKSLQLENGDPPEYPPANGLVMVDGEGRKKSVTFAPSSPALSNTSSQITPNTPISPHAINIPGTMIFNSKFKLLACLNKIKIQSNISLN